MATNFHAQLYNLWVVTIHLWHNFQKMLQATTISPICRFQLTLLVELLSLAYQGLTFPQAVTQLLVFRCLFITMTKRWWRWRRWCAALGSDAGGAFGVPRQSRWFPSRLGLTSTNCTTISRI
jgi:hypothetical protein